MINLEYINIDKNSIPYEFEMSINNVTYRFLVKYNSIGDFFTIDLYKGKEVLVLGEKVIYKKPLFTTTQYLDLPTIIPYDTTGKAKDVTFGNLGEDVFLFIVGDDDVD